MEESSLMKKMTQEMTRQESVGMHGKELSDM